MTAKNPVVCDCLNDCGDDPWLADGRSFPCQRRVDQQARERAFAAQSARVNAIIAQYAAADIYSLVEHLHAEVTRLQEGAAP